MARATETLNIGDIIHLCFVTEGQDFPAGSADARVVEICGGSVLLEAADPELGWIYWYDLLDLHQCDVTPSSPKLVFEVCADKGEYFPVDTTVN
jgi:hypothetical protein